MNYMALANELINVRENLLQVPTNQHLSKMVRGELFVLNYLATHENNVHPKELSEKMAVSTARISSLLNHMQEKKLIQRYVDQLDNRQVIVVLTEVGRQEILRIRTELLTHVCAMLEGLGPEDAEAYIRIQKKIFSNHQTNR